MLSHRYPGLSLFDHPDHLHLGETALSNVSAPLALAQTLHYREEFRRGRRSKGVSGAQTSGRSCATKPLVLEISGPLVLVRTVTSHQGRPRAPAALLTDTYQPMPQPRQPSPRITIALCTYNGARWLKEQLNSYLAQTDVEWALWVSDDGSTDATRDILERFAADHGARRQIRIVDGPRQGPAANFLSLLCHPDLPPHPVALSDQDDVWLPCKLSQALTRLDRLEGRDGPTVYCAQSMRVTVDLTPIGPSRIPQGPFRFGNALVQNVISGHSAVLNPAGLALVRAAGPQLDLPFHDWWLYLLISGAGGTVIVDDAVTVLYRQHEGNLMGANRGPRAALARAVILMRGEFRGWTQANAAALGRCELLLTAEAAGLLREHAQSTARWGMPRMLLLHRLSIRRHSYSGTAALYLAAALGRV